MAGRRNGSPTPQEVDFSEEPEDEDTSAEIEVDDRPRGSDGHLLTMKQVRSRARRMINRGAPLTEEMFEAWCGKPIDQWDLEELARGRTKDKSGGFRGRPTPMLSRAVHERILEQYKMIMKQRINMQASTALGVIGQIIGNDDTDDKGKPLVPASVKLDASKWLVEHVLGKPVQPRTDDISIRLQGILGEVMVNPTLDTTHPDIQALPAGYSMGHIGTRGEAIDVEWTEDED